MSQINWELYVITESSVSRGRSTVEVVEQAVAGGASAIQLREKELSVSELLEVGRIVREITREAGVPFIINDRVDIALALDADGVHLGARDFPVGEARRLLGNGKIIGATAHNIEEVRKIVGEGVDYIGFGPIFGTTTKKDALPPRGLDMLKRVRSETHLPLVAIGGINHANARSVIVAGADAVAVISAVVSAPDIKEATRQLVREIRAARETRNGVGV